MNRHVDDGFALVDVLVDTNARRFDRVLSQTRALFDDRNLGWRADRCTARGAYGFSWSCLSRARGQVASPKEVACGRVVEPAVSF
jgi:hypothetical protein